VAVLYIEVQVLPSPEVWSWNALAYAVSQASTTWQIALLAPRSTWIHCGSAARLDQRVPEFPSTALDAESATSWTDDAVAGRLRAALLVVSQARRWPVCPATPACRRRLRRAM
jgi:hypothetical protein